MNRKRVLSVQLTVFTIVFFLLLSCGSTQQFVQTQAARVGNTAAAEGERFAKTEVAHLQETAGASISTLAIDARTQIPEIAGTLSVQAQTQVPQAVGTLSIDAQTQAPQALETLQIIAQTQIPNFLSTFAVQNGSAPFKPPTFGYLGMKYKQDLPDNRGQSIGIDIWASTDPLNAGQRGSPVYAVYEGKLGRTAQGVVICHPKLDPNKYPGLPFEQVCTFYDHLVDLPAPLSELPVDACPNGLVDVKQGDLLGYMDQTDMTANSGVVHLSFGILQQDPATGCWKDNGSLANTLDPFTYLGLDSSRYSWLSVFP